MSAQQVFALCIDCREIGYGITDSNGVYSRDSGSSNHFDCETHVFGAPNDYPPIVRNVLTKIQAHLPISDAEMWATARQIETEHLAPKRVVLDSIVAAEGLMSLLVSREPESIDCEACSRSHPATREHCAVCGRPSLFIDPDNQCRTCKEEQP